MVFRGPERIAYCGRGTHSPSPPCTPFTQSAPAAGCDAAHDLEVDCDGVLPAGHDHTGSFVGSLLGTRLTATLLLLLQKCTGCKGPKHHAFPKKCLMGSA